VLQVRSPDSAGPPAGRLSPGQRVTWRWSCRRAQLRLARNSLLEELLQPAGRWCREEVPQPFQPIRRLCPAPTSIPIPHSHFPLRRWAPGACSCCKLVQPGLAGGGVQLFRGRWRVLVQAQRITSAARILRSWLAARARPGCDSRSRRRPGPVGRWACVDGATGSVEQDRLSAASAPAELIDLDGWLPGPARSAGAAGPAAARMGRSVLQWSLTWAGRYPAHRAPTPRLARRAGLGAGLVLELGQLEVAWRPTSTAGWPRR